MSTIHIKAVITTVAPLSITLPETGFPLMGRGLDEGKVQQTGYLPATTFRGVLRRAAAFAAMEARGVGNNTVKDVYADMLGQRGNESDNLDFAQILAIREADPITDLFGSWSIRSRLLVSNFVPQVNVLPYKVMGVRKDLDDTEGALDYLSEDQRAMFWGRSTANASRAAAASNIKQLSRKAKKGDAAAAEALAAAEAAEAEAKKLMGDMQNGTRSLVSFDALPAGIELSGSIIIESARPRDLPMVLLGLDALSRRPLLGAQLARGCGEVSGKFIISVDGVQSQIVTCGGWLPARVTDFSTADLALNSAPSAV